MNKNRLRVTGTVMALAALLGGCGGSEAESDEEAAAPEQRETEEPEDEPEEEPSPTPPARSKRCLDVEPAKLAAIAAGEEDGVGGITFSSGAAVKSEDYSEVYMIAGRFTVPGVKQPQVGIWASNSLAADQGVLLAVDGFAEQFTVWPDADDSAAKIRLGSDGVDEAKECLE